MSLKISDQIVEDFNITKDDPIEKLGWMQLPYKRTFSLLPMIEYIEEMAKSEDYGAQFLGKEIMDRLQNAPELFHPLPEEKPAILEKYRETLQLMMMSVLTPFQLQNDLAKIAAPFSVMPIYHPCIRTLGEPTASQLCHQ